MRITLPRILMINHHIRNTYLIFLIFLIFCAPSVLADAGCGTLDISVLYLHGELVTNPLVVEPASYTFPGGMGPFGNVDWRVHNTIRYNVSAKATYKLGSITQTLNIDVPPLGYYPFSVQIYDTRQGSPGVVPTIFEYLSNDFTQAKWQTMNCQNSPDVCTCPSNQMCNSGTCVDNPDNPPNGSGYCQLTSSFQKIGNKLVGDSCSCDFQCKERAICSITTGKCVDDCSNPPNGMECCNGIFRIINSIDLNNKCNCNSECKQGICLNEKCQDILPSRLTCKSGTDVKKGDELYCNLVARNTILNSDVKATFILDAGNGLAFTTSDGCQNIKGSQCIGTFAIADLSNEGVEVRLQALAGGDTKISGVVTFPYQNKTITESVPDLGAHVYYCGDGKVDPGETKETCCEDTGANPFQWYSFINEKCDTGAVGQVFNWPLILAALVVIIIFSLIILKLLKES